LHTPPLPRVGVYLQGKRRTAAGYNSKSRPTPFVGTEANRRQALLKHLLLCSNTTSISMTCSWCRGRLNRYGLSTRCSVSTTSRTHKHARTRKIARNCMRLHEAQKVTQIQERAQTCTIMHKKIRDRDWRELDVKCRYIGSKGAGWRAGQ
jgi:hypothetical protein